MKFYSGLMQLGVYQAAVDRCSRTFGSNDLRLLRDSLGRCCDGCLASQYKMVSYNLGVIQIFDHAFRFTKISPRRGTVGHHER